MPKLLKVTKLNGKSGELKEYAGIHVPDIEHFKYDLISYLRRSKGCAKVDIAVESMEDKTYDE
jgi:hypothetical protein